MITLRRSHDRGQTQHGWLESWHSFSFGDYYDPVHMGFRQLRVINEDRVQPGHGFPPHSHRDMEIISYVLEGELEHRDSLGNGSVIRPGEVQRMSAGTGITHSEMNPSPGLLHFLQIWILPQHSGLEPSYEQRAFPVSPDSPGLRLVASSDGRNSSVTLHQNVDVLAGLLPAGGRVMHRLDRAHAWLQVVRGTLMLNEFALSAGDGAAISNEPTCQLHADRDSEVLLFDLA